MLPRVISYDRFIIKEESEIAMKTYMIAILMLLLPCAAMANHIVGIGGAAGELLEPTGVLADFFSDGAIILGVMAMFGAFVRYMQHRVNPLAVPIGSVIVLLVLGILLVCLPFTYVLLGAKAPIPGHISHLALLFK
ncbi:MAG: hypothetical protein K0R24_1378 [Gammaproteobacteria bacterium]|jgi:hypothetical protein|nr:hypothetical protein [Gammaproteobacteria bacterium]